MALQHILTKGDFHEKTEQRKIRRDSWRYAEPCSDGGFGSDLLRVPVVLVGRRTVYDDQRAGILWDAAAVAVAAETRSEAKVSKPSGVYHAFGNTDPGGLLQLSAGAALRHPG